MKKKNKNKVVMSDEALSVLLCNMDGCTDYVFNKFQCISSVTVLPRPTAFSMRLTR